MHQIIASNNCVKSNKFLVNLVNLNLKFNYIKPIKIEILHKNITFYMSLSYFIIGEIIKYTNV